MNLKSIKSTSSSLLNHFTLLTVCSVLVHQVLIATSVYASVRAIDEATNVGFESTSFRLWCSIYVLCMTLPYFIAYFGDIFKEKWLCRSLDDFWLFSSNNYALCTDKNDSDNLKGVLVSQGKEVITNFVDYLFHSISAMSNFGFSLLVISILLDYRFFISILISSILIILYKKLISPKMEKVSEKRNENGSALSKTLTTLHDNYHHGSRVNHSSFELNKNKRITTYLDSRIVEAKNKYSAMLVTSLFAIIPTSSLLIYLLFSSEIDTAIKLGIIVNLTRIYHLLVSANELVSIFISLPNIKGQLKLLTKFADSKPPFQTTTDHIKAKDCQSDVIFDVSEVSLKENGLLAITGRNGSGKSSYLKQYQREVGGLYFNPSYRVSWLWGSDAEREKLSDGEYTKKCLEWLISNTDETLLLDEWDAFLDKSNTTYMEELLIKESEKRLILQVRQ